MCSYPYHIEKEGVETVKEVWVVDTLSQLYENIEEPSLCLRYLKRIKIMEEHRLVVLFLKLCMYYR
jgi:hypothetical protein